MNVRPSPQELARIRCAVGEALRFERDLQVAEPAPESLLALLRELENRMLEAKREKVLREVDARIADLMRACGVQPSR
jgi:hypothetical protein